METPPQKKNPREKDSQILDSVFRRFVFLFGAFSPFLLISYHILCMYAIDVWMNGGLRLWWAGNPGTEGGDVVEGA